jgi:hypothetical protein
MTEFNPSQQLNLIDEMIMSTKKDMGDNGFHFLYWGWLVLLVSLGFYAMAKLGLPYAPFIWFALPVGAVVSIFFIKKEIRKLV